MISLSAAPSWMNPISQAREQMQVAREAQATAASRADFYRANLFNPSSLPKTPGASTTRGSVPPEVEAAFKAVEASIKIAKAVQQKRAALAPLQSAKLLLGAAMARLRSNKRSAATRLIGQALAKANAAYAATGIDVRSAISAAVRSLTDTAADEPAVGGAGGGRTALYVGGAGALALLAWKFLL